MTNQDSFYESNTSVQTSHDSESSDGSGERSLRRILEPLAIGIIGLGFFMIFQPFTITLYTYSYTVMLVGLVLFIVASHLPE